MSSCDGKALKQTRNFEAAVGASSGAIDLSGNDNSVVRPVTSAVVRLGPTFSFMVSMYELKHLTGARALLWNQQLTYLFKLTHFVDPHPLTIATVLCRVLLFAE